MAVTQGDFSSFSEAVIYYEDRKQSKIAYALNPRHARVDGHPAKQCCHWIPACAGMT